MTECQDAVTTPHAQINIVHVMAIL